MFPLKESKRRRNRSLFLPKPDARPFLIEELDPGFL
jgi:hypothetical protein